MEKQLQRRHIAGPGQRVVHEGAGEQLPGAGFVDCMFEQGLADAGGNTAVDLAFDHEGIDDCASILGDDIAVQRHGAGLRVDLDLADVAAGGRSAVFRPVAGRRAEIAPVRLGQPGQPAEIDPAVGAGDGEDAARVSQVAGRRLQRLRRQVPPGFDQGVRRQQGGRTADGQRAAGAGAGPGLDPVGIALDDTDARRIDAEPCRRDLGKGRGVALSAG